MKKEMSYVLLFLGKYNTVKLHVHRYIFDHEFNFMVPKKDTCQKCDVLKLKITAPETEEEKSQLLTQHEIHLCKAEIACE